MGIFHFGKQFFSKTVHNINGLQEQIYIRMCTGRKTAKSEYRT